MLTDLIEDMREGINVLHDMHLLVKAYWNHSVEIQRLRNQMMKNCRNPCRIELLLGALFETTDRYYGQKYRRKTIVDDAAYRPELIKEAVNS